MPRRLIALALLTTVTVAAAACGSDDPGAAATTAPPVTTTSPTTAPPTTEATRPTRIVSLSPSLTEMLYAIGAGDQVVAVDKYSNHPAGTPMTDLSGFRPNIEAIAELDPDLVVVASDRDGVVAALDRVGIPTTLLTSAASVDDTAAQLTALGAATGHAAEATAVVEQLRDELAATAARVPEREAPLTYYLELSDDGHSATSATFLGEVLAMAGLVSIADGLDDAAGGYPQLSAEYILAQDPDIVFFAHSDGANPTPEEVAGRPGWEQLAAVTAGRVVDLDPDVASRWGPRVADLLTTVVDATAEVR